MVGISHSPEPLTLYYRLPISYRSAGNRISLFMWNELLETYIVVIILKKLLSDIKFGSQFTLWVNTLGTAALPSSSLWNQVSYPAETELNLHRCASPIGHLLKFALLLEWVQLLYTSVSIEVRNKSAKQDVRFLPRSSHTFKFYFIKQWSSF